MKFFVFIITLLAFSCTKKQVSAEDVLSGYIQYRFKSSQSKTELLSKTTGELYQKIVDMDEDTFKKFSTNENKRMRKYRVDLSRCSNETCFITYTLSYDEGDKKGRKFETEIKKIAELQLEDGAWKIADVSNIKTYIDSKRPLSSSNN